MRSEPDALSEPAGSAFGDGSESADRERNTEDAEIVVIDLVPQAGVADLVEPLELVEADGIAVGHEHAMEHDGQTRLAEGVDFLGFPEKLSNLRESASAGGRSNRHRLRAGTRRDRQSPHRAD